MPSDDTQATPAASIGALQIIVAALMTGIVVFAVIAIFRQAQAPPVMGNDLPTLTLLSLVFAGVMIAVRFFVGRQLDGKARERLAKGAGGGEEVGRSLYQNQVIIRTALLEGAAFFLMLAYMAEGALATVLATFLLLALIGIGFPTAARREDWLQAMSRRQ